MKIDEQPLLAAGTWLEKARKTAPIGSSRVAGLLPPEKPSWRGSGRADKAPCEKWLYRYRYGSGGDVLRRFRGTSGGRGILFAQAVALSMGSYQEP
ncbi:MAG: hypothetical protein LBQ88_14065 [Treponema sp.]|nr:hypothetical protein [Treponema sp.]